MEKDDHAVRSRPSPRKASNDDRSDIDLLHSISVQLIGEQDRTELYCKIVDAAVAIMGSQAGTMQLLCQQDDPSGHGGELQLLAHQGLPEKAVQFWRWVRPSAYSSCTMALRGGVRTIIPDYEQWEDIAGTQDLLAFRAAGIRSAQTTPLWSRSGKLLGMISTHWHEPHEPSARDLRLLDILARQAADALDRTIAEEALARLAKDLAARVDESARELLASEAQVRQMQKMEAIGQLTGGVAHDFNNLLTVIRSSAELLGRRELPPEKQKRYIDAIMETSARAAKLTGQLLAFARRQPLRPETFDVARRVEAVADMLRTVVGSRVELVVVAPSSACYIDVDASQFETALVNMAVNARDAMKDEGRLEIAVEPVDGVPARRGHAAAEGTFVRIAVSDIGSGMSREQLDHIFEPFFTTKAQGKGIGLGLSQVYGFAKQSNGEIDVASEPGRGTTFSLYLPMVSAPGQQAAVTLTEAITTDAASILVVEDNDRVGEFAAHLLADLGFVTRRANNAREAIAILERDHATIDIVFSDVVMPGVDGFDLGRQIRSRWPYLTVVLTSGYSHVLARESEDGFLMLQKPYSVDELSVILRDAVASDEDINCDICF